MTDADKAALAKLLKDHAHENERAGHWENKAMATRRKIDDLKRKYRMADTDIWPTIFSDQRERLERKPKP